MNRNLYLFLIVCLCIGSGTALADDSDSGLNADAMSELRAAGVDKYLGTSAVCKEANTAYGPSMILIPIMSRMGLTLGVRPDGPVCIAGTNYSVFTRQGDPKKLLIFLQGGGACWQGFYNCNVTADAQSPPANGPFPGVFDPTMPITRLRITRLSTCRTVTVRPLAAITT